MARIKTFSDKGGGERECNQDENKFLEIIVRLSYSPTKDEIKKLRSLLNTDKKSANISRLMLQSGISSMMLGHFAKHLYDSESSPHLEIATMINEHLKDRIKSLGKIKR